jgi:V/A-type H+-transporting ATPase subunit D
MAIKFQYNKTSLQELDRQLRIRVQALPTLKNKEAALRVEVKKLKYAADACAATLEQRIADYRPMFRLWDEFGADLVRVQTVNMNRRKIAGVQIPVLDEVVFEMAAFSLFNAPHWWPDGVKALQTLAQLGIERQIHLRGMALLDRARKKTTQKVNLYEKVQIPEYEAAIRKIKRFMEDEENLSKAAQKIVKNKQAHAR